MDSESQRPRLGLGDLLMGRYRLDAELFVNLPNAQRFLATDKILSRLTEVHLLTGPHTEDAVDAARRAALVDDPRIARIIDAGRYSGVSFVLTAPLEGVSLADVGPLPAAQARAVAGEVATALAGAAARDVHHLALRPELIFLGKGDTVRIGGMAWDAAQRGIADQDAASSSAIDAKALVAVLYAALTARWPGETHSVMPAPPLWDANPVAPIELVSGVPGDLNTLCAVALAVGGVGPVRADQVVSELGAWPPVRINLPYSASVRGPIPRAVTPPAPLPLGQDAEVDDAAYAAEAAAGPEPPAEDPPATAWKAGAEPFRPTDADVAALATQAVIQDQVAAIEAIVVPPSAAISSEDTAEWYGHEYYAEPAGYQAEFAYQPEDDGSAADPRSAAHPGPDAAAGPAADPAPAADWAQNSGEADGRLDDGIGQDEDLVWPRPPATPPPALSSLAEKLEPAPVAPRGGIIAKSAADPAPQEFALPPLPEDLAEVLASVPPLTEDDHPYEPVAVGEIDEDATLILEPIEDDYDYDDYDDDNYEDEDEDGEDVPATRERPPNRAKHPQPSPLSTPVRREEVPPGPDDEGVREILARLAPPRTQPPVDLLADQSAEPAAGPARDRPVPEPVGLIADAAAKDVPGVEVLNTPAAAIPQVIPIAQVAGHARPAPPNAAARTPAPAPAPAPAPETGGSPAQATAPAPGPPIAAGPAPAAERRLFDVEAPPFDNVLEVEVGQPPPKRNWWPIITFIAVLVACLSLGLLILQQVGILSVGVPLGPDSPLSGALAQGGG
ncbi:MAG: hypothetical protein LBG60_15240 [Bifidobacteriaceae bacterium]|jgi:hypothetical protein|nr:hypothetical protein [Bifidobacteriaceae bacterium]